MNNDNVHKMPEKIEEIGPKYETGKSPSILSVDRLLDMISLGAMCDITAKTSYDPNRCYKGPGAAA
jgi:hypothetical protein